VKEGKGEEEEKTKGEARREVTLVTLVSHS